MFWSQPKATCCPCTGKWLSALRPQAQGKGTHPERSRRAGRARQGRSGSTIHNLQFTLCPCPRGPWKRQCPNEAGTAGVLPAGCTRHKPLSSALPRTTHQQNPTKVATERSPASDSAGNAGWDAGSFQTGIQEFQNGEFHTTYLFLRSKLYIFKCTHSQSKANSRSFNLPIMSLVFQEFQINDKQIALCLKAFFCSSCLQFSTSKYGRKDEWFMNAHFKKSNNILKQYFIAQWNRVKQTVFTVIFIERTCRDFWQEKQII